MAHPTLSLFRKLQHKPLGTWLFSRLVCFKAPYFASIAPRITVLEPGRCEVRIRHRRAVTNHLGTVHAIALCNVAELAAGLMTEVSIPASMRWIPRGMTVAYLKKATGTVTGTATPAAAIVEATEGYSLPVAVEVKDPAGTLVFRATVEMWVSPKR